jgi:hypothetical protein
MRFRLFDSLVNVFSACFLHQNRVSNTPLMFDRLFCRVELKNELPMNQEFSQEQMSHDFSQLAVENVSIVLLTRPLSS